MTFISADENTQRGRLWLTERGISALHSSNQCTLIQQKRRKFLRTHTKISCEMLESLQIPHLNFLMHIFISTPSIQYTAGKGLVVSIESTATWALPQQSTSQDLWLAWGVERLLLPAQNNFAKVIFKVVFLAQPPNLRKQFLKEWSLQLKTDRW